MWLLTVGLVLAGQFVLTQPHDENLPFGLGLLALAAVGWLALRKRARALESPEEPLPSSPPLAGAGKRGQGGWGEGRPRRIAWLVIGLALAVAALTVAILQDRPKEAPCWDALALWGASIALILAAGWLVETCRPLRREALAGLRAHWTEVLLVAGITLAGLVPRAVALDSIPFTLGGDEASQGLEAIRFIDGRLGNMFVTGWLGVPTMSFLLQAVTIKACGPTVFGLRILWAIVGAATLPALYALGRQLFDRRTALVATAFLAAYHYHIHFSRLGSNQVADGLFMAGALAALVWGLRRNRSFGFALSGVIAGLGMYFYAGARLVPVVLATFLALVVVTSARRWRAPWLGLLLLALGFLVVAAPMLTLAVADPDQFNARLSVVGVFQSDWLPRQMATTGMSQEQLFAWLFLRAALAFNHYWDYAYWYGLQGAFLDLAPAALFVLGFVYSLTCWRERRYAVPVLWVALTALFGAALTENPPAAQRLIGAAPGLAILVAVGLLRLVDLARDLWGDWLIQSRLAFIQKPLVRRYTPALIVALAVCAMAAYSLKLYFVDFTPQRIYGNPNGLATTILAYYLRDHPADRIVYFFGAPRVYYDGFSNLPYIAPHETGVDVRAPLQGPPTFVDANHGALFVFVPERLGEHTWVVQSYPGGTWLVLPDHQGQMILSLYEVSKAQVQQATASRP